MVKADLKWFETLFASLETLQHKDLVMKQSPEFKNQYF